MSLHWSYSSLLFHANHGTAQNTVVLSNFLVWKFCGNAVSAEFWEALCFLGDCAFLQNFSTIKLGEILVFHAVGSVFRILQNIYEPFYKNIQQLKVVCRNCHYKFLTVGNQVCQKELKSICNENLF